MIEIEKNGTSIVHVSLAGQSPKGYAPIKNSVVHALHTSRLDDKKNIKPYSEALCKKTYGPNSKGWILLESGSEITCKRCKRLSEFH